MLRRFGQAAMLAALLVLSMSSARAEAAAAKGECGDCCCKDGKCCKADKTVKSDCCCKDSKCCKDDSCCKTGTCCKDGACCKKAACCKDGKCACGSKDGSCCKTGTCCKDGKCACGSKAAKCGKSCSCCKDTASCKCQGCCTSGKCCKAGTCCASKTCCQGACGCSGCSAATKRTAKTPFMHPIIVVLPFPMGGPTMPVCGVCPAPCGTVTVPMPPPPGLTPPMMPPQTVAMPVPPLPPCYGSCPATGPMPCPVAVSQTESNLDCLSILGMVTELCCAHAHPPTLPAMCMLGLGMAEDLCAMMANARTATEAGGTYHQHPPQYVPCVPPARPVAILPPPTPCEGAYPPPCVASAPMMTCSAATPAPVAVKVRIVAKPNSDQLEMNVGADACMTCKKMVMKVGDNSLTVTRMDDQVRIRATELRAKADCVRTDRKDRLILEGGVTLHYSKDGQCTKVMAECVELNLATGAVAVKAAAAVERIRFEINQP